MVSRLCYDSITGSSGGIPCWPVRGYQSVHDSCSSCHHHAKRHSTGKAYLRRKLKHPPKTNNLWSFSGPPHIPKVELPLKSKNVLINKKKFKNNHIFLIYRTSKDTITLAGYDVETELHDFNRTACSKRKRTVINPVLLVSSTNVNQCDLSQVMLHNPLRLPIFM